MMSHLPTLVVRPSDVAPEALSQHDARATMGGVSYLELYSDGGGDCDVVVGGGLMVVDIAVFQMIMVVIMMMVTMCFVIIFR